MRVLLVVVLLVGGCISAPGWTQREPGVSYPASGVVRGIAVLETAPPGAVVLGHVRGFEWAYDPLTEAKYRAADLGADAIVVTGSGTETVPIGAFSKPLPFVDATALRVAK